MQRRAFRIDIVAIVFYLILAGAILFALNVHTIWQFLSSHYLENSAPTQVDYSTISPPLFNYLNKFSSLTLMLFWAIVGTIGYVLAIWLETAFSSVVKEAKESGYVRPASKRAAYWYSTIFNNLMVVGLAAGWIVSLYVFIQVLLPKFSKMLNHSLNSGTFGQRAGYLAASIILTAACLFLIVRLSHLLKRFWRRFSS